MRLGRVFLLVRTAFRSVKVIGGTHPSSILWLGVSWARRSEADPSPPVLSKHRPASGPSLVWALSAWPELDLPSNVKLELDHLINWALPDSASYHLFR